MARNHGRIRLSIWSESSGFRDLTGEAQRMYFLALTQPDLSLAGVVPYTAKRWARLARNSTVAKVHREVAELERHLFVATDVDTEELLIRSFVRHDGILDSPNVAKRMLHDFRSVHSQFLRGVFLVEMHRIAEDPEHLGSDKVWETVMPELLHQPLPEGLPEGFPERFGKPIPEGLREQFTELFGEGFSSRTRASHAVERAAPAPTPSPAPAPRVRADRDHPQPDPPTGSAAARDALTAARTGERP